MFAPVDSGWLGETANTPDFILARRDMESSNFLAGAMNTRGSRH